ncbi:MULTISPECIES: hypothetical protein [Rhizobium/Agrobacterium group]|uniref:hypothetical protein n=1 Tax=Rhizobium/Agrobacterium group TaxID=227290 RepID=UPI001178449E|nr:MULTISPECIES: hypothetical protein [Rhizobium/Agrobacterium group]MCF1435776.1 hypothetical protein [Allorhizobium ampelinum]MCF1483078.1 hypothetical protein [Allorhizobium ampelinum]MUO90374.1 hypothetical protein [Agrobacterium vitis]MUZ52385.1 hypothetical protein [Agrobacterium vitis]MUZ91565.1 hypothetical protein [Agrobacterium vitis]
MTFLIAMAIGIATATTRSIMAIVAVSLVLLTAGLVMLALSPAMTAMDLLTALIAYNVGLIDCLMVSLALSQRKIA